MEKIPRNNAVKISAKRRRIIAAGMVAAAYLIIKITIDLKVMFTSEIEILLLFLVLNSICEIFSYKDFN